MTRREMMHPRAPAPRFSRGTDDSCIRGQVEGIVIK